MQWVGARKRYDLVACQFSLKRLPQRSYDFSIVHGGTKTKLKLVFCILPLYEEMKIAESSPQIQRNRGAKP
jgi:hypothetical protein